MSYTLRNAVIKDTMLGFEDHGIPTAWIFLDHGGGSQGFGGYSLADYSQEEKKHKANGYFGDSIMSLLNTIEVTSWENLKGKSVRIIGDRTHIVAIGHYIKDKWFSFEIDDSWKTVTLVTEKVNEQGTN